MELGNADTPSTYIFYKSKFTEYDGTQEKLKQLLTKSEVCGKFENKKKEEKL